MTKQKKYNYLLDLYRNVDDYLDKEGEGQLSPDTIVSFCIVTERVLKIKLYRENPVLVFGAELAKEDKLIAITMGKEVGIKTTNFETTVLRFGKIFGGFFSKASIQVALRDIYEARNHFVHSHKADREAGFDQEDVLRKMGLIWEEISKLTKEMFGEDVPKTSKPNKSYDEKELERVVLDQLKQKIRGGRVMPSDLQSFIPISNVLSYTLAEICPRCRQRTLSLEQNTSGLAIEDYVVNPSLTFMTGSNYGVSSLYKCSNCGLELTGVEYEIAKKNGLI